MKADLVKDALVLTAITLVSGLALGGVHAITEEPIAAAQEATVQAAYREVFSDADSFTELEGFDAEEATALVADAGYTDDDIDGCMVAADASGETLGYVITVTSHAGYGGDITLSMGVTVDGVMNGYSITDISETAGLGMKSKEPKFKDQFNDLAVDVLSVVKGTKSNDTEIEAISGATITSRAVTGAVNAGFVYYESVMGLIGGAE